MPVRSSSGSRPAWQRGCAIRGSVKAALDLREPTYGWFGEGFGTVEFKHADYVLDELRQ